jgi:tRNA (adenine57-N1/adenine58-N1)-methyltransferase
LDDVVTVTHADVYTQGFCPQDPDEIVGSTHKMKSGLEGRVDAVFLDLPEPWRALPHLSALFCMDKQCRVATFSPCMEQVQKTVVALKEHGFTDIRMFQLNQREWYPQYASPLQDVRDVIQGKAGVLTDEEKKMAGQKRGRQDEDEDQREAAEGDNVDDASGQGRTLYRTPMSMQGHTAYLTFANYTRLSSEEQ